MRPRPAALPAASVIAVLVAWAAVGAGAPHLGRSGPGHRSDVVALADAGPPAARLLAGDGLTGSGERWRGPRPLPLIALAVVFLPVLSRRPATGGEAAAPAGRRWRWPTAGRAPPPSCVAPA